MSLPARISLLVVAFLGVVAIGAFVVIHYFLFNPAVVDYSSGVPANTGATVHVVMQEDPQNTVSTHPDWVSYFIQNPQTKAWEHTTLFSVPAGSRIDMTIYGFDGCTPLRNNYWGKVTGVDRQHRERQRQAVQLHQLVVGLQRRAHVLDPVHQPERADGHARADPEREAGPVRDVAVRAGVPEDLPVPDHDVQLHDAARGRRVLLAVPGSLRWWFPHRIWWSYVDDRFHDREHDGGVLMAAEAPPTSTPQHAAGPSGPNHGLRIFLIWLPVAIAADLIIWLVWKPHMPPGDMSVTAANQQFDTAVLALAAAPVMAFVLLYFAYSLVVWRARPEDDTDGPSIHGNTRIQATWITVSSVIVLAAFVFGTVELYSSNGAGSGQGASPIQVPGGAKLQVQVIGQQWKFTYRYPQYGGFETTDLVLPTNSGSSST